MQLQQMTRPRASSCLGLKEKTIVQIDMSTLQPDSTTFDTMSIYKYLLLLEKHKKVTAYDLSYAVFQSVWF